MSEAQKGMKRKPVSEETRRKISKIHKGKFVSEKTRKKLSLWQKGKTGNPVIAFNKDTGDFEHWFPSAASAGEALNICPSAITKVILGRKHFYTAGKLKWELATQYN